MPTRPSKNVATIYLEVSHDLKNEMQAMADRYGHSLKEECVTAFRRHIAFPPPPPETVPPLPLPDSPEAPKGKKAKK
jgi:hypothetical protein